MIRNLLKVTDCSLMRATQLFLTFESHIIRNEGEQGGRGISRRFNLILFWQHWRGGHVPSGLGMAHGEEKKALEARWWHQDIMTSFLWAS